MLPGTRYIGKLTIRRETRIDQKLVFSKAALYFVPMKKCMYLRGGNTAAS